VRTTQTVRTTELVTQWVVVIVNRTGEERFVSSSSVLTTFAPTLTQIVTMLEFVIFKLAVAFATTLIMAPLALCLGVLARVVLLVCVQMVAFVAKKVKNAFALKAGLEITVNIK